MIRRLQRKDFDQLEILIKEFYMDYNPKFLSGIQSDFEEYVDMDNEVTKMTQKYINFKSSQKAIFVDEEAGKLRGYIYCYVYHIVIHIYILLCTYIYIFIIMIIIIIKQL